MLCHLCYICDMGNIYINLKKLVFNTGQIEGVPRNPLRSVATGA